MAIQPTDIKEYQPIEMQEPAQPWQSLLATYDEYFNPEMQLARESLQADKDESDQAHQIAKEGLALDRQKINADIETNKQTLKLQERRDEGNLFIESTKDLNPTYVADLADSLGFENIAKTNRAVGTDIQNAKVAINTAITGGDANEIRKALDNPVYSQVMGSPYMKEVKAKAERNIEGAYAKEALMSISNIEGFAELNISTAGWENLNTEQALRELTRLPSVVTMASGMSDRKIQILKETAGVLEAFYKSAADAGTSKELGNILTNLDSVLKPMVESAGLKYQNIGKVADDETTTTDEKPKLVVEPKFREDVAKVQNSRLWDAKKVTVPGPGNRRIFDVRKAKQTISKILNRNVSEKEARAIYARLEGKVGRAVGAAQDLAVDIGRGAVAGTKAIAATAQGVPPELAFQGISSPAGATSFAGPPQEDVDAAVGEMNQYENLIP